MTEQATKSGEEPFRTAGVSAGFALIDYWRWSESDLLNNTRRAIVAEFLVARAVGAADEPRVEWASVDVATPEGVTIEVKSSAYVQSWPQRELSNVSFDIAPRTSSWDPVTNETVTHDPPRRMADVYVFCVLGDERGAKPDPLNLAEWHFYVIATLLLDRELPSQRRIGLQSLKDLIQSATGKDAGPVRFEGLQQAIKQAAAGGATANAADGASAGAG